MTPRATPPRPRTRRLERGVLAAGLASAGVLLAVAWRTGTDVGARGELAAAELVREAAELVSDEWDAWLARPEPPAPPFGQVFRWSQAEARGTAREAGARRAAPPVDVAPDTHEAGPLDLLLDEAARLERDPATSGQALPLVRDALERIPSSPARPEAWLRCIQLARRAGDCAAAREAWASGRSELEGRPELVRGDTSYALLARLAVAPCLDEVERRAAKLELEGAWREGLYRAPDDVPRLELAGSAGWHLARSPAREALWRRIEGLAPTDDGPSATPADEAGEEDGNERALEALANELGRPLPAPDPRSTWTVTGRASAPFLLHRDARGATEGFFVEPARLAAGFRDFLRLPGDFTLDLGGPGPPEGEVVRELAPLAGDVLGFRLRHPDRDALVRAERRRLVGLRVALVALALAMLATSFLGARALRRERRLAELKSAFVAGVSHDLRTPLASILLLAENLEQGTVTDDVARERYYPAIRREAARLRRLVDDALDFSRLERGETVRVAPEEHDLGALADELRAEAGERVEAAGGRLAFRVEGELGEGRVDPFALRRAVWNLVDNALTHSGASDVELALRREGRRLVVTVTDAGRGIPPELRARVFEPWASFDVPAGSSGGTGLGLAIVRAIALAHGGDARVESGPEGSGARFELTFDLGAEPGEPPA